MAADGPVHPRWECMSGAQRVWYERLCRRVGCNPVCGPVLEGDGVKVAHELLTARANPNEYDDETVEELFRELKAGQVRVEDEHAARLGLPPRPVR
jgi:hypothetical protein